MLEIAHRQKGNVGILIRNSFYSLLNVISPGLDPSPIELSSSDDDSRPQPPRKRIKHVYKKPFGSEVIDLCSESEDAFASPRHSCTRDERSVVVLSTDEDVDLDFPASSHLAFRKIDTRKSPALSSLKDISPPIEIESVFQASPPPLTHNTLVSKPKALLFEEDGVTDRNNICAKKVGPPRGSLQVLYNEALARCARDPRRKKDNSGQPSPFSSLECVPPARIIRYATQTQSPSLHTPLFFSRVILRPRARQKQPKTLDAKPISDAKPSSSAKPFSDIRASFLNPKAFPDATTFSAVSNDTDLNPMEVSNLNEDQDTPYPDSVMEISTVDSEALEIATVLIPPIDVQDDISSDTQVASISLSSTIPFSVISNDADLNSMKVSKLNEDQDTVTYPDSIMEISAVDSEALEIATQTILIPPIDFQASDTQVASISLSSTNTLSSRASSLSTRSLHSLDSSASIESVNCHLLTQDESPSPHTPLVKVQKQESLICSNLFPSTIGVSFDIDMSELNLQMIMYNLFDEDNNDDDISIYGMELTYPEA